MSEAASNSIKSILVFNHQMSIYYELWVVVMCFGALDTGTYTNIYTHPAHVAVIPSVLDTVKLSNNKSNNPYMMHTDVHIYTCIMSHICTYWHRSTTHMACYTHMLLLIFVLQIMTFLESRAL